MRKVIPNLAGPDRPGNLVESHEQTDAVLLEADGVRHWIAPDAARRIARAMLQAASLADPRSVDSGKPDDPEYP